MTSLTLAALVFTGMHLLIAGTRLRDALVARLGTRGFQGSFSLASVVALGWLIWAYGKARVPEPTAIPDLRWLGALLVFVAFVLIVLGLMTPGPTVVGGEKILDRDDPARGVHRITRHPFLWGVALWALVHVGFNANAANAVFFGTFALVAIVGTFSIDAKRARHFGDKWQRYAARTSNIPFAAIAQGRNALAAGEIGALKIAMAAAAYVVFALTHPKFFGVAPF